MRLYEILPSDALLIASQPARKEVDARGNARLAGLDRNSRAIIVVVAKDDPDFVITTFPED
jgi:hypothetical protein